jgi:CDP-diacylglycerol--serine O-phosphatidyltransferase
VNAERVKGRIRRGASLAPALFTTGNLFLGFWAIVRSFAGQHQEAAYCILGAGLLDALDGRIARLTGTTSEFGAELDSLSDVISFGVAPGILVFSWGLSAAPRAGWLAAFLFVMCGALRLARFNVQRHVVDSRFFVGLPIPLAAAPLATLVMFMPARLGERWQASLVMAAVVALALLMVSTLRYRSFKDIDLRRRRSYVSVLGIAALFLLVALHPEWVLLAGACGYAASGPVAYAAGWLLRRRGGPSAPAAAA